MEKINRRFLSTILVFAFFTMIFIGCGRKGGEPFSGPMNGLKRYPYRAMHLTYEFSGDARGDEELFVSDFGKYESRRTRSDMFSPEQTMAEDKGSITRGFDVYILDFLERSVLHERVQYLDSIYHLDANDIPTPQQYFESEMKKNFFAIVGTDMIDGKPATRWKQTDGDLTLWVWNCILLRKHIQMESKSIEMTIKTIDTLWTPDTTTFMIPQGFHAIESPKTVNAPATN